MTKTEIAVCCMAILVSGCSSHRKVAESTGETHSRSEIRTGKETLADMRVRESVSADTMRCTSSIEEKRTASSDSHIVIEQVIYDTGKSDSTGREVVKERRTTRIARHQALEMFSGYSENMQKTRKSEQRESHDSLSAKYTEQRSDSLSSMRHERKDIHPTPWRLSWLYVLLIVVAATIVGIRRMNRPS